MKLHLPLCTLACATLLPACHSVFGPHIRGSGVVATQVRQVGPFARVHVRGSADVVAHAGGETHLEISGDDNLLPYVVTRIDGDTLVIEMEHGNSYSFERGLDVELSAPRLESLSISGSGEAELHGLQGESFEASLSGSGSIRAAGRVERLEASISGSGDMHLYELEAREAVLRISGSGEMRVHATETIDAAISGSGDISYRGEAATKLKVAGSGDIHREGGAP